MEHTQEEKKGKYDEIVFVIENGEVEEISYGDLVRNCAEETTTPEGNGSRLFYEGEGDEDGYEACTWGVCNNYKKLNIHFKTEEEAEEWLLDCFEIDLQNSDVIYFETKKEAEDYLISQEVEKIEKETELSKEDAEKKAKKEYYKEKKAKESEKKAKAEQYRIYWLPENIEARKILHDRKIKKTIEEFPQLKEKFLIYLKNRNANLPLSNREANSLAWKKQNWITVGADIVTLRNELKKLTTN